MKLTESQSEAFALVRESADKALYQWPDGKWSDAPRVEGRTRRASAETSTVLSLIDWRAVIPCEWNAKGKPTMVRLSADLG